MSIDEFLEPYPSEIMKTCEALRSTIASLPVEMEEKVYTGWKLIGYRVKNGSKSHYIGFIAPCEKEKEVRLGFEYGVKIKHSPVKLEGKGTQVRYAVFTKPEQVKQNKLVPLILEAIDLALKGKK